MGPGVDRTARPTHNADVTTRPRHPGFAFLHTLTLGGVVGFAALGMIPQPELPSAPAETVAADPTQTPDGPQEAIVILQNGRQLTGLLMEQSDEKVVLRINGIDTTFARDRVAGVRMLPPIEERYRELRSAVDDSDIHARLAIVEWLRAREAYRLALQELEGILKVEPDNPDARTLQTWLTASLELRERSTRTSEQPRERRQPPPPEVPLLTESQINRIRVYEVDLSKPTRMIVPDETMRTLMIRFPDAFPVDARQRDAILDLDPVEKLRIIFERRARDLYDQVRVLEDPPSMAAFKSRIAGSGGWLINACASNRCHGGAEAGRLRLVSDHPNSDASAYTNFLILERFKLADGTPLINHQEPARSPLLHMSLPRRASLYPHPEIDPLKTRDRWRPIFRSTTDHRFEESAGWIASLYTPRPDYAIDYPPTPHTPQPAPSDHAPTEDPAADPRTLTTGQDPSTPSEKP